MFQKSILIFFLTFFNTRAEVDPPNYNFKLDQISSLLPGKTKQWVEEKYGKGETYSKQGEYTTVRYKMKHVRYIFPFWIQYKKGKSVDLLAKLPSYFLHDIFHQSLINRYGPQDHYLKKGEHAVYRWQNKKGFNITYSGACTITCFPVYIHMEENLPKEQQAGFKSLLKVISLSKKKVD